MDVAAIARAREHFGKLLEAQMKRMEKVKAAPDWIDYSTLSPLKIGILPGDGIGPFIAAASKRERRDRRGVRRLRHGLGPEPQAQEDLGSLRQGLSRH